MYKIAIVGDKESILGFKAIGIDVFSVKSPLEARKTIDSLAKDDDGVIFITEEILEKVRETVERYDDKTLPAIIPVPNSKGTKNIGMKRIEEYVEKAVGSNIL